MYDWHTFRPMGKWVIVQDDPRLTVSSGGILLPDQMVAAERVMEGTGTVLKVGPEVAKCLGRPLEPGMRICFRGFLKDAFHEFEPEEGRTVFLLRAEDVLLELDKDVKMGFAS